MTSTRQLILDYLKQKPIATAQEISRALDTTAANIRHHLSILTFEGAVDIVGERPTRKRGRPSQLYMLASQARQNNLGILAASLLTELSACIPEDEQLALLRSVALRLAGRIESSPNLPQRLYIAVRRLNELQYRARWEAHLNAPFIILGHCPFSMILTDHPELCQIDNFILEGLLTTPVKQVEKLAIDNQGASYCRFLVLHR